jgi:hypothetical protein
MIDLRHPLSVLAARMPWTPEFDTKLRFLTLSLRQPQ